MRWKMFIPAVVITILAVVFNIFFLDNVLKAAFIKTNQMIFNAKTEVKILDFNICCFNYPGNLCRKNRNLIRAGKTGEFNHG